MKITKSDLQQIIQEEAERMFRLEKLEETKRIVDQNIRLISEGKKKMSDEELEELWAGLKSVLGAGAKAVGQAVSAGAEKVQQFGQKVADTYKQGEQRAKVEKLKKQQMDLANQMKSVNDELAKLQPPTEDTSTQKKSTTKKATSKTTTPPPVPKSSSTKVAAGKTTAPKGATSKGSQPKATTSASKKTSGKSTSPYSVTE